MNRWSRLLGARQTGGWFGWLSLVAVFAVTTAGVASGPVFLESVGDALAVDALAEGPSLDSIVRVRTDVEFFGEEFVAAGAELEEALADVPLLQVGATTLAVGANRTTARAGDRLLRSQVRLVARDGAVEALDVVERGGGDGVWIAERVADVLDVGADDTITITDPEWPPLNLPIAGIYRDIDFGAPGPFWELLPIELVPRENRVFNLIEPELFLLSEELFLSVAGPLGDDRYRGSSISLGVEDFPPLSGRAWWQTRPISEATGAELISVTGHLRRLQTDANDPTVPLGASLFEAGLPRLLVESDLLDLAGRVDRAKSQISPAIASVEITVVALGLVVIAIGSWFVTRRRLVEIRMWTIEGRSPWSLGAAAVAAAVPAAAVGTAIGLVAIPWIVRVLGPSDTLHPESVPIGGVLAFVLAGLTVVFLVASVIAMRVLADPASHRSRRWVWDVALYGVAAALLLQLLVRDPVDPATGEVDLTAMFFPLVAVSAVVAAALRAVGFILVHFRRAGSRLPFALFLAWRRIAATATASASLLFPIGVAAGVAIFSSSLVASLENALDAKSIVAIGSNVSVPFARTAVGVDLPDGFAMIRSGTGSAQGSEFVLLMMIDPEPYEAAVPWDPAFGPELDGALALIAPRESTRVPVLVAGPGTDRLPTEGVRRTQSLTIAYEVVGRLDAIPLMAPDRPTMVFRRDTVLQWAEVNADISGLSGLVREPPQGELPPGAEIPPPDPNDLFLGMIATLVTTQSETRMIEFLESIDHPTNLVTAREDALSGAGFAAPRWAFDYLRLLAYVAMLLSIAVYAFAAVERRRRLILAHGLMARMGLSRLRAGGALAIEIVALVSLAGALGTVGAAGLSVLVAGEFDPLPALFPVLAHTLPLLDVLLVGGFSLAGAGAAWWYTHRSASRADVAEVLRVG